MRHIQSRFIAKSDIVDIVDELRKEVGLEMRLEMRRLGEDIKYEREKKKVEEELRKKHFEAYFLFLLDYYQKHDLQ